MTNINPSLAKPRPIALCADDYGYRPGVSTAITRLAQRGRLSATSALVTFPDWARAGAEIDGLAAQVDVGLHLDFVEGKPLSSARALAPAGRFPGINRLILMALSHCLPLQEVRDEAFRQADAFLKATGRLPDFIDGHQHAHALPGVCAITADLAVALRPGDPLPVRVPGEKWGRILSRRTAPAKALSIAVLTKGMEPTASALGVPVNAGFSGIYDFAAAGDLAEMFSAFVHHLGARPLIMCHPGDRDASAEVADPITAARQREADYLASDDFVQLLERENLRLDRFTRLAAIA